MRPGIARDTIACSPYREIVDQSADRTPQFVILPAVARRAAVFQKEMIVVGYVSQARNDLFDLFARRCPTKAEANGAHSDFRWNLHSLQYRRKLYRPRVAGGAR